MHMCYAWHFNYNHLYGQYLLLSQRSLCLPHKNTRSGVESRYQRAPMALSDSNIPGSQEEYLSFLEGFRRPIKLALAGTRSLKFLDTLLPVGSLDASIQILLTLWRKPLSQIGATVLDW